GGITVVEATTTLQVTRATDSVLADLIAALEVAPATGSDNGHLQAALAQLRQAQQADDSAAGLLEKIQHGTAAGEKLGRIKSLDLSSHRADLDRVIGAWERRHFETAHEASIRYEMPKSKLKGTGRPGASAAAVGEDSNSGTPPARSQSHVRAPQ